MSLWPILFDVTLVVLFMLREDIIFRRVFYLVVSKKRRPVFFYFKYS